MDKKSVRYLILNSNLWSALLSDISFKKNLLIWNDFHKTMEKGEQLKSNQFWKIYVSTCGTFVFLTCFFLTCRTFYLWRCLEQGICRCHSISGKPRDPLRQWLRATPAVRTRPSSPGHCESRPQQPRPRNPSPSEQPRPQRLIEDSQVW